ncbi:UNVERIFIED_CONTAM: LINE-1 retrotransposable element O protein [Sesamum latifolium]|uniref:LINE-1 retrotransposable element O protein n=1 Tax=Sesamum latifolium TaxID=2727402 RepID=A0AAW2X4Z0_9LAMI
MKILLWNCHGLGSAWTVQKLMELVKIYSLGLVFISETKCRSRRYERLKENLNYHGTGVDVVGRSDGLLLLWHKDIEVWHNHIDVTIKSIECLDRWHFTRFYGSSNVTRRKELWNVLWNLTKSNLQDLRFEGDIFIGVIIEKPPTLFVLALIVLVVPTVGLICFLSLSPKKKVFSLQDRLDIISRLCCCYSECMAIDYSIKCVKQCEERICALRGQKLDATAKGEIERLYDSLNALASKEEVMWKQRVKALWLTKGDRNTRFFRAKANERRLSNEIKRIKDRLGMEIVGTEGIRKVIVDYFGAIFSSTRPLEEAMDEVLASVESRVTENMNSQLIRSFTIEEIMQALNQMNPLKSPGPDGMSPIFYQKFWDIVGPDACACILEFLNGGDLNSLLNFTQIVLFPKCPNPTDMSNFHPISLCNVIYKLTSKVLANRPKPFLDSIIPASQTAFVPGRIITDNLIIIYRTKIWEKRDMCLLSWISVKPLIG